MNTIVSLCVKQLQDIQSRLQKLEGNNNYADGANTAIMLIKEAISLRIEDMMDLHPSSHHTSSELASFCLEFIYELKNIFSELSAEQKQNEFGKGYRSQVKILLENLVPLITWLKTASVKSIYNS